MKSLVLFFGLFLISAGLVKPTTDDRINYSPCYGENEAFTGGEKLTYKLYYNWGLVWLSAGEVVFTVDDMEDRYHLKAVGRTYKSYEWFYKVRDVYESEIDKTSLLPFWGMKDIKEGGYERYDMLTFDRLNNKVISDRGKTKEKTKITEFDVPSCTHDILSCIYQLRTTDVSGIEEGDELPINFFLNGERYDIKMKYKGDKGGVKVKGMGKFDTYHFSPELVGGDVFQEGTEMNVFVSKDDNKIPLLIESPLKVGTVKAVLKSYEGLKNNFNVKG